MNAVTFSFDFHNIRRTNQPLKYLRRRKTNRDNEMLCEVGGGERELRGEGKGKFVFRAFTIIPIIHPERGGNASQWLGWLTIAIPYGMRGVEPRPEKLQPRSQGLSSLRPLTLFLNDNGGREERPWERGWRNCCLCIKVVL